MKFSGQSLAVARNKQGLSQEQLAALAKVSTFTVSRLERDENEPTIATLTKLAQALGVNPQALLSENGTA